MSLLLCVVHALVELFSFSDAEVQALLTALDWTGLFLFGCLVLWVIEFLSEVGVGFEVDQYVVFGEDPSAFFRHSWHEWNDNIFLLLFPFLCLVVRYFSRFLGSLDKDPVCVSAGLNCCLDVLAFLFFFFSLSWMILSQMV